MSERYAEFEQITLAPAGEIGLPAPPIVTLGNPAGLPKATVISSSPPPLQGIGDFPAPFRPRARLVRSKYHELYQLPVLENANGSRTFHQGVLYRRHGIHVLFLKGDVVEMAFQHGRLLAPEIAAGCVVPASLQVEHMVANTYGSFGPLQRLIAQGIHRFLTGTMLSCALAAGRRFLNEAETFDETIALSDATGIAVPTLIRALFSPEVLLLLAKLDSDAWREKVAVRTELPVPASCCSSFAAWGSYTADGQLLIGRNMDYPLNGYYDQQPTVIYYEPTDGHQKYMAFASAGLHCAGLNGYNESGIFVGTHSIPSTEVSASGVPVFTTAQNVVRHAKTFNQAVKLFQQAPPAAGWGYIVASCKEGRVGSVELSNRQVVVRESEGEYHVQTNHYLTPELRDKNLLINTSVAEDNDGRYIRLRQRVEAAKSRLDAEEAVSILGDQVDPYLNEVRGLGSTVGVHTTMTSLVLQPASGRVYVASGRAPVCHGPYVELPLVEHARRDAFLDDSVNVISCSEFPHQHPVKAAALQIFIQAKSAYEYENDFAQAYDLLEQVTEIDDTNPAYFFQLGIFALKCKDYAGAEQAFESVFTRHYLTPQLRRLAHYYRGRMLAHLGRSAEAQEDFAAVLADPETDNKLRSAALWLTRTVSLFGSCRLRQRCLNIMMQQSDMLHY